jgi:acetolactate synthase I/II/III large subunit
MSATLDLSVRQSALAEEPVGDLVARFLAEIGVTTVFGVISIHNMPILDAIHRQQRIRFVPARGEAGAMNMADAYARVSNSLGVVITSTGTAAGNSAGAQVEALTAGSPLLHITTQVDRPFMDRDRAAIHDVPRQADMLKAISKGYCRVWEAGGTIPTLTAAASMALSAPRGPVSVEIPVDVQRELTTIPKSVALSTVSIVHRAEQIKSLAELVRAARRPLLWLGGGARGADNAATQLVGRGFCAVTSTNGRAVVPEDHPRSLGAFNMTPQAQSIYRGADLMIVVGSRLRGNESLNNRMVLPRPLVQIDADASQGGRNYPVDLFIHGEARLVLDELLAALPRKLDVDPGFGHDVSIARASSEGALREQLGPYLGVADALLERVAQGRHPFVRDVTIANSTFGNRYVTIAAPNLGVHALGGGIGQGIAMAIGASLASRSGKTVALIGDGGAMVNLAELLTAVDEKAEVVFVLMNDKAYGVIRNIQDVQYRSRHAYSALRTPDFARLAASFGLAHRCIDRVEDFAAALDAALGASGPQLIEIDMVAIGPFGRAFSGPPAGAAGAPSEA